MLHGRDFTWRLRVGMSWVLGDFVVFGWDPVEMSLSIHFEDKSRVYKDEKIL